MKYRVTGEYRWKEYRPFQCTVSIDTVIEAEDEKAAIEAAINATEGEPDDACDISGPTGEWRRGARTALSACTVI